MEAFKEFVSSSNSVVAAHAMVRALLTRRSFHSRLELAAYLGAVCNHMPEAKQIAQAGLDLIAQHHANAIWLIDDRLANSLVEWLSEFVVERASGRAPDPDRGRTLLTELRKFGQTE